jgi:RNA polymerase sigma-70 factor (ECF subfamily)
MPTTKGAVATPTLGAVAAEIYCDVIHRYLLSRAGRNDVSDLEQEVYLKLIRVPFDTLIENPEAFIISSARQVVLEHLRRENRRRKTFCTDSELVEQLTENPELPGWDEPAHWVSSAQFLESFLMSLPPEQAAALVLHKRDGFTYEQIAAELHVTPRAVRRYLVKAKEQLLRALEKEWNDVEWKKPHD